MVVWKGMMLISLTCWWRSALLNFWYSIINFFSLDSNCDVSDFSCRSLGLNFFFAEMGFLRICISWRSWVAKRVGCG